MTHLTIDQSAARTFALASEDGNVTKPSYAHYLLAWR